MTPLQVDSRDTENISPLSVIQILTVDGEGKQIEVLERGSPLKVILQYCSQVLDFKRSVQVLLKLINEKGEEVARDLSQLFFLDSQNYPNGEIEAFFPAITLSEGAYTLDILCAEDGFDFHQPEHQFLESPLLFFWAQQSSSLQVKSSEKYREKATSAVEGQWSNSQYTLTYSRVHSPTLMLDFPDCLEKEFPEEFPMIWDVVNHIIDETKGRNFPELERNSPGLKGFNWDTYLRCSAVRMARLLRALKRRKLEGGTLLDVGSYFGNFSLMLAKIGFQVVAVDSYKRYGKDLEFVVNLLKNAKIEVLDFQDVGENWNNITSERFDVIACLGVIEHIPHTPRQLLEPMNRVLKTNGWFLLDTPNLAYLYNRQKLARGESVFLPINIQYYSGIPFDGHHREYTSGEIQWLLQNIGHDEISIEAFNYSLYSIEYLRGKDLENYFEMMDDKSCCEYLLATSQKK